MSSSISEVIKGTVERVRRYLLSGELPSSPHHQQQQHGDEAQDDVQYVVRPLPIDLQRAVDAAADAPMPEQPKTRSRGRTQKPSVKARDTSSPAAVPPADGDDGPATPTRKRPISSSPIKSVKYKGPDGQASPNYKGRGASADDDGSCWRKYGEKLVRESPNPRSYYKCTEPGCPARKVIERHPKTEQVVNVEYRNQHNHGVIGGGS